MEGKTRKERLHDGTGNLKLNIGRTEVLWTETKSYLRMKGCMAYTLPAHLQGTSRQDSHCIYTIKH